MLEKSQQRKARPGRNIHVGLATCETEILEAQKLRYRVFAEEMGARLCSRTPGVDRDLYDPWCEHLIVRDEDAGRIVGTYRILSPAAARKVGGYYTENEFDLTRLQHLRSRIVEIGRSCIDAEYRSGAVIAMLWSGLARYMRDNDYDYLIGCASVSMADGGHNAASLYNRLRETHLAPLEYHVFPRCPLPLDQLRTDLEAEAPPLIKGYLRAGAWICGEPAWDPDFNTADLPILMPMGKIEGRYARHFLEREN
ncbi:MAG: GNAT family N-acetyltransferase [Thauera phenolivorans]|uniref:L-ornithine N(alpha)-acyltransferase n=1 Tax=Thauera phenolivorans TaxID=1792543 RepID=A0A7X7LYL8_9RHOO|nr:GNAT family N-acyltransferase [Thauera phenolivorans]NLF55800.1 GNAT family N-acetyltransferase [Thauera phenolivorans]